MNMPGFTSEASLYQTARHYRPSGALARNDKAVRPGLMFDAFSDPSLLFYQPTLPLPPGCVDYCGNACSELIEEFWGNCYESCLTDCAQFWLTAHTPQPRQADVADKEDICAIFRAGCKRNCYLTHPNPPSIAGQPSGGSGRENIALRDCFSECEKSYARCVDPRQA